LRTVFSRYSREFPVIYGTFPFFTGYSQTGLKTQGVALINKIRMLDLNARDARKIETAPPEVIEDAIARLESMLET
jgi:mRNA interferase ChpB